MTERLVVDASVVAKVYLRDEEHTDLAVDLVTRFVLGQVDIVAPEYILYEVPSAILNAVRRKRLSVGEGLDAVQEFFQMDLPTVGEKPGLGDLTRRAYVLAQDVGCRLYDALYVAVAQEFDYPLVTCDAKLYRGLSQRVRQMTWLGDYRSPS